MACPEIPASPERSQRNLVASFFFLLELTGIYPTIRIRKIGEISEIREITAAVSKKRAFLCTKKRIKKKGAFFFVTTCFLSAPPEGGLGSSWLKHNMLFVSYLNKKIGDRGNIGTLTVLVLKTVMGPELCV